MWRQAYRPVSGQRSGRLPSSSIGSPVLGEKQHAAAYKSPVSGEHQRRKLGAKSHRTNGCFTQWCNHHGVNHAACRCQKVCSATGMAITARFRRKFLQGNPDFVFNTLSSFPLNFRVSIAQVDYKRNADPRSSARTRMCSFKPGLYQER